VFKGFGVNSDNEERIKVNILIYEGRFQYDVVNYFAKELAHEFIKAGHDVILYDLAVHKTEEELINILVDQKIELIISFNFIHGMEYKTIKDVIKKMNIIILGILVDAPFYHQKRIEMGKGDNVLWCMYDEGDMYIAEQYMDNKMPIAHLYHAGSQSNQERNEQCYDVIMAETISSTSDILASLEAFPDGILKAIGYEMYERVQGDYSLSLNQVMEEVLRTKNINAQLFRDNIEFREVLAKIYVIVDKAIRNEIRYKTLERLLRSGISVDLFGNCNIESFNKYINFTYHGAKDYYELIEEIKKAKILVANIKTYDNGSHERILTSMLNKTMVMANKNTYCGTDFSDGNEIVYFDLNSEDDLIHKVKYYLDEADKRNQISENAYKIAYENHTWATREKQLEELYSIFKNNYVQTYPVKLCELNRKVLKATLGKQEHMILPCLDDIKCYLKELRSIVAEGEDYKQILNVLIEDLNYLDEQIYSKELVNNRLLRLIDTNKTFDEILEVIYEWINKAKTAQEQIEMNKLDIDKKFFKLVNFIKSNDKETLIKIMIEKISEIAKNDPNYYNNLKVFYNKYEYFWGALSVEDEVYDVVFDRADNLINHLNDFIWLYNRLQDQRSKFVLNGILYNWITFKLKYIQDIRENSFPDYYDSDIMMCDENEVFVDLGAFNGDSIKDYINTYGAYKKIYGYEITPTIYKELCNNISIYKHVECRNKAVGESRGIIYVKDKQGGGASANKIDEKGDIPIQMVSLDEDIQEKITFLKMDIEGAEQGALRGAKGHISNSKPKLAICTYHSNSDIWKIPKMIYEMNPEYKFYMRYNGCTWWPSEYVLLTV